MPKHLHSLPAPLAAPKCPWCPYTPAGPWALTLPASYQCTKIPVHPWQSSMFLWHPYTPRSPQCPLIPYTPTGPKPLYSLPVPNATLTPPDGPQHPYTLYQSPNAPWGHTLPASPNAPLPAPWHPCDTPTPLLVQASSGKQCYYCRSAWHPQRASTYKRLFTLEGNYIVCICSILGAYWFLANTWQLHVMSKLQLVMFSTHVQDC